MQVPDSTNQDVKYFIVETWEALPQALLLMVSRWERLLDNSGGPDGPEMPPTITVARLRWLPPVAEALQRHPQASRLDARVHHAVIEVRYQTRQPNGIMQTESLVIFAITEEVLTLRHSVLPIKNPQQRGVLIAQGGAEEIAAAVVALSRGLGLAHAYEHVLSH